MRIPYQTSVLPISLFVLSAINALAASPSPEVMSLTDLGFDQLQKHGAATQPDAGFTGHALSINNQTFTHGISTHGDVNWWIDLNGTATHFAASVGLDDETKSIPRSSAAAAEINIVGDHKVLFRSRTMKIGDSAKQIDLDLTGVKTLIIMMATLGGPRDSAHFDIANASIQFTGTRPQLLETPPVEAGEILTPAESPAPRINSAKTFGVRPGHPVLYTIAATGARPITFSADNLPQGLSLDSATGQITGSVEKPQKTTIQLTATNAQGTAHAKLLLEVGDTIALTPPMGWNSWNCFAAAVSDEKVRAAADAMVSSGLINHGWTYINIDDCWEVRASSPADQRRKPDGMINTNNKFPDMKALADYIHSKGLRAGLYSSPGPTTCGRFTASYEHELQDASQYAAWGFDYLKYDWCSYGTIADKIRKAPNPPANLEIFQHPYTVMHDALLKQNRDILFSLCQYGMGDVWQWGADVGGNCWRTTGDINDSWRSMANIGFNQNGHEKFARPGHWNDPDMLVVGKVGWGPALRPTKLTPNEQYTHITLWSLLSAPLLIGCDMTQLDDFTRSLLTNDEVLAINQDPLGHQAARVSQNEDEQTEVWAKDLEDGTKAVGLFNRGELSSTVTVNWSDLNLKGPQPLRDLWRQKDLGNQNDHFSVELPRHGAFLIKIGMPN